MTQDEPGCVRSPCPDIQRVEGKTITEFLWEKALQWGDAMAFECGVTGRKYTYSEVYAYSQGFAASLIKLGIQVGDVMGLILPNIPEYPIALFGAWDAGCIVSTVNPSYTSDEIIRQLTNAEAQYVVTSEQFLPAVIKAQQSCRRLQSIIVVGSTPGEHLPFFDMINEDTANFNFLTGQDIDPFRTTALLPYSSGTTGPPKGVELTHANLIANTQQFLEPGVANGMTFTFSCAERTIAVLPFFHVYGLAIALHGVYEGHFVLCLPRFEPTKFIQALRHHQPTSMRLVPPLVAFLAQSPDLVKEDLASLRRISVGAAVSGLTLINKFLTKTNHEIFYQEGYGMTELSPITHVITHGINNSKIGSFGTPLPSTLCKIIDYQTGKSLGPNENGELCIKGPQVMKGYFKNEEATAEIIDSDGWLHTGDICYYDEDNHFYIVDRIKELIKVKGFQVSPSELENILREHEQVDDVAVIGIPDEKSGELPRAYIVRKGQGLTADQINFYLQGRIATYKQLKGGIEFVESIPKTPSGKILRRVLMAEYKKQTLISV